MKNLTLPSLLACAALATQAAAQTDILVENFSDLDRTNQNLPSSSTWYLGAGATGSTVNASADASGGGLVVTPANGTARTTQITTYFTNSGAVTLADGQTLTASFTLSLSNLNDVANGFRIGLYNSGGSRIAADNLTTQADAVFGSTTNYRGYQVTFNPSATSGQFEILERTGGASTTLFAAADHTSLGVNNASIGATATTPFTFSFSISRAGDNLSLTSIVNGQSVTSTDTSVSSSLAYGFDTLAVFAPTATLLAGQSYTLDNVSITVIPEPASFVLLSGLGFLGFAALRRRR